MLNSFFADVRNLRRQFFLTAFCVADFQFEFLDVDGGVDIVAYNTLGYNDRILEVVTLPWHVCHEQVTSECELAILRRITFAKRLTLHYFLPLTHQRRQVDTGILVRPAELDEVIRLEFIVKADESLLVGDVVLNRYFLRVDTFDHAVGFRQDQRTRVERNLAFQPGPHDRRFRPHQRYRLALHVRSHQRTVCIIVFQERDQRSSNRHNLVRRDVHVSQILRFNDRKVTFKARLNLLIVEFAVRFDRDICLRDIVRIFFFGSQVDNRILHLHLAILNLAVRCFDEAHLIDLRMNTKRGDQPDVRPFRRLDGTQATIVRIVHIANLKACAFAGKTTWPERRHSALVSNLRQRIGLIHELRKLVRSEE